MILEGIECGTRAIHDGLTQAGGTFTAPAFGRSRLERWIRWLLVAHGAMALPVYLTYFVSRTFIYGAAVWSVTLAMSGLLIATFFHRLAHGRDAGSAAPVLTGSRA